MKRQCVIFGSDRAKVEREALQVEAEWKFGDNGLLLPDTEMGPIEEFANVGSRNVNTGSQTSVGAGAPAYRCILTQELEQVPLQ
jgi:hypothetical protein